jgi:glycosyltransferase involved in cell wall biosynthesis
MTTFYILLFGTQMAVGGAQKVLLDQAAWFHSRNHKVVAAFFYDRDGLHEKWQKEFPFPILNLSSFHKGRGRISNLFSVAAGMLRLWKLLKHENFDAIEAFTHDSNMLALPLARMARVPVRIASHHGIVAGISPKREKIHAWLINHDFAQRIVAVSAMTRQKLLDEGIRPERIVVIPNGIHPVEAENINREQVRKEAGIGASDPFLLAVGRLVPSKAHKILIDAMPTVLEKFPNAKAGICGDGILRRELERQIEEMQLQEAVKLLGHSEHVENFLLSADIFVMPSFWEGLPIALLEAMSAGLPVIATRVEGIEETVEEGKNGLLIPPGNTDALAKAVIQLLTDEQVRHKMGLASQEKIRKSYSAERMCEQYLELISEFAKKEPQG